MAAKKSTSKKSTAKKAEPKAARNLGTATGVAEARKTKERKNSDADMREVFEQTAEDDAREAKMSQSAKHVKQTHLLAMEQEKRLRAARLSTSTHSAIEHDLQRVIELSDEIAVEAQEALRTLGR